MRLEKVRIKGFRNFDDTEVIFQKKTLIIGANDVGKSNLLYALRILFDKTISEHDLELTESDYNAYSGTDTIEITAYLCEVTEDCLLSTFGSAVKDGKVVIRYTNQKNGTYKILTGYDVSTLSELQTRQYIKRLNMQYVDTNRNLFSFLSREKIKILQIAKEKLSEEATASDSQKINEIQNSLDKINESISSLQYISTSLAQVNRELGELSVHNEDQAVRFVAGESKADKMLDNLVLAYSTGDTPLSIGGDGRNNQIFLATWIAKQHLQNNIDHVTFYAIEEPEAHLHPHQQRKLSAYIQNSFDEQILITTHSPHIASKFEPASIVRLYSENKYSFASCGGCSELLKSVFDDFGYRLNALSAETFFSDGVFLVEGTSEVLFYTALARELKLDLDRHNISILSVEGVGFKPYVAICNALNISWVLRTDNDIFSKTSVTPVKKYYAGISRGIGIVKDIGDNKTGLIEYWNQHSKENEWPKDAEIPEEAKKLNEYIRTNIKDLGIFLSDVDLENDLASSELKDTLMNHYGKRDHDDLVNAMQKKKAENMMKFLTKNHKELSCLEESKIVEPLTSLIRITTERTRPDNGERTN